MELLLLLLIGGAGLALIASSSKSASEAGSQAPSAQTYTWSPVSTTAAGLPKANLATVNAVVAAATDSKRVEFAIAPTPAQPGVPMIFVNGTIMSVGYDAGGKRYFDVRMEEFWKRPGFDTAPKGIPAYGTIVRIDDDAVIGARAVVGPANGIATSVIGELPFTSG
jgi:hypothetical protein